MKRWIMFGSLALLLSGCGAVSDLLKVRYRIEFSGTANQPGDFTGSYKIYTTSKNESKTLTTSDIPASVDLEYATSSDEPDEIDAYGSLASGGTIKVKIIRNGSVCKESSDTDSSYAYTSAFCFKK